MGLPFFVIMKKIAILMGSKSDLPVMKKTIQTLKDFEVPYEAHIFSAHRTPENVTDFVASARKSGFGVIIAAAGMAAHLAGAIAAKTTLPVVGVPLSAKKLEGMDALLSTVQMPPGIPVGTVGIDAAENAALYALEILAVTDDSLQEKLKKRREEGRKKVLRDDEELNESDL